MERPRRVGTFVWFCAIVLIVQSTSQARIQRKRPLGIGNQGPKSDTAPDSAVVRNPSSNSPKPGVHIPPVALVPVPEVVILSNEPAEENTTDVNSHEDEFQDSDKAICLGQEEQCFRTSCHIHSPFSWCPRGMVTKSWKRCNLLGKYEICCTPVLTPLKKIN